MASMSDIPTQVHIPTAMYLLSFVSKSHSKLSLTVKYYSTTMYKRPVTPERIVNFAYK